MTNEKCPCGSGLTFAKCCGPLIKGTAAAPTAESLMRSRYSAYVKAEVDYRVANKLVCFSLLAILYSTSNILFAGTESLATDEKDSSKEVVPLEKSWCETPPPFELRIGLPA